MADPYDTIQRWALAFNEGDYRAVGALYAPKAVLWGTLARTLINSPQSITAYFAEAATAGLKVTLGDHTSTPLAETCAADAGHYELSRIRNDVQMLFPARYSIVLVRTGGAWTIAHHHSSMLPTALD